MSEKTSVILKRFIRGAVASAVSSMVVIAPVGIVNFHDLTPWLVSLGLAGVIGLVTGGLQALDKALRWNDEVA